MYHWRWYQATIKQYSVLVGYGSNYFALFFLLLLSLLLLFIYLDLHKHVLHSIWRRHPSQSPDKVGKIRFLICWLQKCWITTSSKMIYYHLLVLNLLLNGMYALFLLNSDRFIEPYLISIYDYFIKVMWEQETYCWNV